MFHSREVVAGGRRMIASLSTHPTTFWRRNLDTWISCLLTELQIRPAENSTMVEENILPHGKNNISIALLKIYNEWSKLVTIPMKKKTVED